MLGAPRAGVDSTPPESGLKEQKDGDSVRCSSARGKETGKMMLSKTLLWKIVFNLNSI